MKKKIFIIPATVFLLTSLISCSNKPSFEDELINKLSQIDSIKEINKLGNNNPLFKCGVEVYFEVPINWNDVEGEKLRQRVIIDAKSFDIPNVVELQGYSLSVKYFNDGFTRELPKLINSNFIAIEHRFFDKSSYVNANYDDASGWEQLTVKNEEAREKFVEFWNTVYEDNKHGNYRNGIFKKYNDDNFEAVMCSTNSKHLDCFISSLEAISKEIKSNDGIPVFTW